MSHFYLASRAVLPCVIVLALLAAPRPGSAEPSPSGGAGILDGLSDTAKDAARDAAKDVARDVTNKSGQNPADAATPVAAAAPAPAAHPVVEAARALLADKAFVSKANGEDAAALTAFYSARADALWIKDGAFTDKANAVIAAIKKADDWGLNAADFELPLIASGAEARLLGDAEVKLSYAALKYARYARGGRVEPLALSNILDMKPPVKEAKTVLTELSDSASPDAYLRGLNPKHPEFEKLRQALLRARGPQQPEAKIDDALKIKLPDGKTLKLGAEHDDVVLLRQRLKMELSANANGRYFDDKLEAALKVFQAANEIKDNGQLNAKTRAALNREGEPKKADPKRDLDRLVLNMERWRWLPEDLGPFYVMNNIPEFVSRTMKGNEEALKQKIIVGQPSWPTPVLTSSMEFVIFRPEWGVPDGIKVKELLPRLKRASGQYGGGGFFDQLFGGGSSGGARVLAAYKLQPSLNGRPVDANSIDWNSVDIRRFSFVQPAGGENPLGQVKFRFPNRHDVYMHDTPQKALFGQTFRALSHGCMRAEQPRKFAEVILAEDKGWSADKVNDMYASGGEVALSKPVPVYLTYFTARVEDDGKVARYADIYGHDDRLMSALQGRAVRYSAPAETDQVASASDTIVDETTEQPSKKSANKKAASKRRREPQTAGDMITDALSGLLAN